MYYDFERPCRENAHKKDTRPVTFVSSYESLRRSEELISPKFSPEVEMFMNLKRASSLFCMNSNKKAILQTFRVIINNRHLIVF